MSDFWILSIYFIINEVAMVFILRPLNAASVLVIPMRVLLYGVTLRIEVTFLERENCYIYLPDGEIRKKLVNPITVFPF
jgi:hypothetical protein